MAGLLADITMVVHFGFLVYVVVGGFLAWCWPRAVLPHALATAWGILIVTDQVDCPLTWVEEYLRRQAGQPGLRNGGFIDTYVAGVLYPEQYAGQMELLAVLVVAASWVAGYLKWRDARRTGTRTHGVGV
ncbi:hypothetical protein GCM10012275_18080 [Longimycelium tulufanense]|uniref:DUF2784 domain-containing protein n=1 Tax=Longimycelium tulufanense TaxID=907463 RepID=A0A8J3FU47_9PSEU|nr:DUF2784 domain-containing protein [Longimycelium tulufanense]GGM47360.1 hypothetical protein GCM10012275_18080 [Longimycelium tulufanense]